MGSNIFVPVTELLNRAHDMMDYGMDLIHRRMKLITPSSDSPQQPVSPDNVFFKMEKEAQQTVKAVVELYRDMWDTAREVLFASIERNPWMEMMFPPDNTPEPEKKEDTKAR